MKVVTLGRRIGIFSMSASTFGPASRLLHAKARAAGTTVATGDQYCADGFKLLLAGKLAESSCVEARRRRFPEVTPVR
jgi:hypothetical protein